MTATMVVVLLALPTLTELEGARNLHESTRSGLAFFIVVLAGLNLVVRQLDRNDPLARLLGAVTVLGAAVVVSEGPWAPLSLALLPTLLLFLRGVDSTARGLVFTLGGLAVLSVPNAVLSVAPELALGGVPTGGSSTQALVAGGTIATAGVVNFFHHGLVTRFAGVVAFVFSLLALIGLEPGALRPGLMLGSVMFALPALVVAGARGVDGLPPPDSV